MNKKILTLLSLISICIIINTACTSQNKIPPLDIKYALTKINNTEFPILQYTPGQISWIVDGTRHWKLIDSATRLSTNEVISSFYNENRLSLDGSLIMKISTSQEIVDSFYFSKSTYRNLTSSLHESLKNVIDRRINSAQEISDTSFYNSFGQLYLTKRGSWKYILGKPHSNSTMLENIIGYNSKEFYFEKNSQNLTYNASSKESLVTNITDTLHRVIHNIDESTVECYYDLSKSTVDTSHFFLRNLYLSRDTLIPITQLLDRECSLKVFDLVKYKQAFEKSLITFSDNLSKETFKNLVNNALLFPNQRKPNEFRNLVLLAIEDLPIIYFALSDQAFNKLTSLLK